MCACLAQPQATQLPPPHLDGGLLRDTLRILKNCDGQVDWRELLVLRLLRGLGRCSYEAFALASKLHVIHFSAVYWNLMCAEKLGDVLVQTTVRRSCSCSCVCKKSHLAA